VPFGFGDTVSDPKKEARLGVGDAVSHDTAARLARSSGCLQPSLHLLFPAVFNCVLQPPSPLRLIMAYGDGAAPRLGQHFSTAAPNERPSPFSPQVEFVLCADPKTLQLVARRVRLTKEAAEPEAPEYTKRQVRAHDSPARYFTR
jgi:hypothetical protein